MLEASKIPGRFYRNLGPCDILSIALDTKEPPGHARGIGVNVPHKRAFTLTKEERLGMKKARSEMKQNALFEKLKKEIYPVVRKDVEESMMMMQKTLTLTDSQQIGGEAGMDDAAYRTMIRLQRIYNFLLLHAIISSILDVNGLIFALLLYFWD